MLLLGQSKLISLKVFPFPMTLHILFICLFIRIGFYFTWKEKNINWYKNEYSFVVHSILVMVATTILITTIRSMMVMLFTVITRRKMIFCALLLRKIGIDLHCPFMFEEHENILCHLKVTKNFQNAFTCYEWCT